MSLLDQNLRNIRDSFSESTWRILNMMLGWGTYSGQFTYSITEVFYYITVVLIFVFYLLLVFTFYIFVVTSPLSYRRVRYNDPAVDNLLEIVSNEL